MTSSIGPYTGRRASWMPISSHRARARRASGSPRSHRRARCAHAAGQPSARLSPGERSGRRTPPARPELRTVTKVLVISPAAGGALARDRRARSALPAARRTQLRRGGVEVTLATRGPGGDADWSRTRPSELARGHDAVVCPQGLADEAAELARRLPATVRARRRLLCAGARRARAAAPRRPALRRLPPQRARRARSRRPRCSSPTSRSAPTSTGMLAALGRVAPERPPPGVILAPMGAPAARSAPGPVADARALVRRALALVRRRDRSRGVRARRRRAPGRAPAHPRRPPSARRGAGHARRGARGRPPRWASRERVESLPWVGARRRCPDCSRRPPCALCLAHDGIEHRLAQRTRLLDLLERRRAHRLHRGRRTRNARGSSRCGDDRAPGRPRAVAGALLGLLESRAARRGQSEAGRASPPSSHPAGRWPRRCGGWPPRPVSVFSARAGADGPSPGLRRASRGPRARSSRRPPAHRHGAGSRGRNR